MASRLKVIRADLSQPVGDRMVKHPYVNSMGAHADVCRLYEVWKGNLPDFPVQVGKHKKTFFELLDPEAKSVSFP